MLFEVLFLLATLLAANCTYFRWFGKTNLPPGPIFRFPILGHLPLLGTNPSRTFFKWSKYYGPIIYVQMGSYPAIILNDCQTIRKAFSQNSFSGRPDTKMAMEMTGGRKGFLFSDGPQAMDQRKFTQRFLKDFAYGSNTMETRILDQIPSLLEVFQDHVSKPFQVKHALNHSVLSALWSIVAGKTLSKGDESFWKMAASVNSGASMPTTLEKLGVFVKLIPKWLPEVSGFNRKVQGVLVIQKYLNGLVDEHRTDKVVGAPRDLIDAYLDQVEKTSDPRSSFFHSHGSITFTLQDLFFAGVETSTTSLEWMLFYLAKYPVVQERLQKEIEENLGTALLPSLQDRAKLPFVEAVIQEVLRISSFVPLSTFHNTMEDTELNGYSVPKDTMVFANIYGVHHDPDVWGDPEIFRPDRFLDEGKLKKIEELIPFSLGKRNCIGEQLGKFQLFLYTVSIFQRFSLKPVRELPSEEGVFGFTNTVNPFEVEVSYRK